MTQRHTPAGPGGHAIVPASPSDIDTLSQVIADAFLDLAPCQWLIGDRAARREIFPGFFRMYVAHAMADGLVYTTPDRTAAALWIPRTGPAEPPEGYDEELAEVTGRWAERFVIFDAELEAHHLAGVAHHHLAILAVRPDWQGRGIGTALLDAHHALLDKDGTAAYLEASDDRNRRIYLRHGYADYGSPIQLPDGPAMYPMTREPGGGNHREAADGVPVSRGERDHV
jgi:GNAT superfamily N-acetyltransferase